MRSSADTSAAKEKLKAQFSLSSEQAEAVTSLRLGRLTNLETKSLADEQLNLENEIKIRKGYTILYDYKYDI